ncbi:MAG TPA: hypothetical protein VJR05_09020 [Acidimicrobiia bacterium]|nr:hypothetical protein [Acidimicrobiia bacterium]
MHRLVDLSPSQRSRLGWLMMLAGSVLLAAAVIWIHYSSLSQTITVDGEEVPLVVDYFNWIPRAWYWKALGYLAAFAASQLLLGGAVLAFVLGRPMTWSRATFAAFLAWIELVLIFGIVPSEWLNLAQTDLDWSPQKIALQIPPFLVLGNDVALSFAALKDSISMGYHVVMIVAGAIFALQVQQLSKPRPRAEKPTPVSPYGRPLIRPEALKAGE